MKVNKPISTTTTHRRGFIKTVSMASVGVFFGAFHRLHAFTYNDSKKERYKIAVCDWMILKRQKLSAFTLAHEIEADGIEMDMGGLGTRDTFDSKLGDPAYQKQFKDKSAELGVAISSIAMSGFYAQSFAERPTVHRMVQDCIDTMKVMDVKVAYLPLGVEGDMIKHPERRPAIIKRLQWAGKEVAKIGGVIAVETSFDAVAEKDFLEEVSDKHIKSSFNFANAIKNRRDICAELKILGKKNIAQIHCSNTDGEWIENDPALNMPRIKATLDRMNWKGWLIIERSRDVDMVHQVKANYGANVAYMKQVFQN